MKEHTEVIQVESGSVNDHGQKDLLSPDLTMILFTWVTFFVLLGILYKFAWKKILQGLDEREATIKRSLEEAQKVSEEMQEIEETRNGIIAKANDEAKTAIQRGRKAATEASKVIEAKAKEEAQIIMGNANHEIKTKKEKAHVELRQESVNLAVGLAGKIIDENLSDAKHQKLIDKFIKEFDPEDYENE